MPSEKPRIDPYLFDRQFQAFSRFVEEKSGVAFVSFAGNPYIDQEEGYKYSIHRVGRDALGVQAWKPSEIGSGRIAEAVIGAIELRRPVKNNLVPWEGRYGEQSRPHQPLHEATQQRDQLPIVEEALFRLYREEQDEEAFRQLMDIFGRTYPLMAYLFFLKDRSRYLPLKPRFFDRAFERLGAGFKTNQQCSWENYSAYLVLMSELRTLLAERLVGVEVTVLDAHSFAWMLAAQMEKAKRLADTREYQSLPSVTREAIINARVGQGLFRQRLIDYWATCAVTGCVEASLLRASHIKPWSKADVPFECLDLYNGLLLSPALDACFDAGYVTFDDEGHIVISRRLRAQDGSALGIHPDMHLRRVEPEHRKYLAFHRQHVFKRDQTGS